MVGGYLNEQDMGRALVAVDGAEQGDAINMSYFRSEAISALNSNSRNFMKEVTDNPISRNFLTSTAEQILRSATITFDLKAPEDIWWDAAVDTAWNVSPFVFSKGRYLLKGAKYDVRGMKKFKRKAESQMWRYKNGEDMWPKNNKSWDEVPGTGNDTYIGDSTIITRYVSKKHFKSPSGYKPELDKGNYFGFPGESFASRSIKGKASDYWEIKFKVKEPFDVRTSLTNPWFGYTNKPARQLKTKPVRELFRKGYIEKL